MWFLIHNTKQSAHNDVEGEDDVGPINNVIVIQNHEAPKYRHHVQVCDQIEHHPQRGHLW